MIKIQQVLRKDNEVLLGIGLENAVLDVLTNDARMQDCLRVLHTPHRGLVSVTLGTFGNYPITLNLQDDDLISLFVDGPEFDQCRTQSAAIWIGKDALEQLLTHALNASSQQKKE